MTLQAPPPDADTSSEISMLIRVLREADVRLEELTSGQVDTVSDREGQPFMLRRAQEAGRVNDAAKQAAILSALPANIALLDARGQVVSTNDAWDRVSGDVGFGNSCLGIALGYLASGDGDSAAGEARPYPIADGIRAVLANKLAQYTLDYRSDTANAHQWFRLMVTPLPGTPANGAVLMQLDITEQRRTEEALRRFEATMDVTADAIFLVDRSSMRCIHVNDAACRMVNRRREDLLQLGPAELHGSSRTGWQQTYDRIVCGDANAKHEEIVWTGDDGSPVCVDIRRDVHCTENRWTIVVLARDITERKRAETRITQLNRVYAMLSGITSVIVHVHDRDQLFKEVCRIAVDAGAFKMAWIGAVDPLTRDARVAAAYGIGEEIVDHIKLSTRMGDAQSDRPASRALHSGRAVVCNDIARDRTITSRDELQTQGVKSLGCFPLGPRERPEAVLTLLSDGEDTFDAAEIRLIGELAADISFAMDHIAKEEKLNYLAYYDELTGLANRSFFLERVAQFLRGAVGTGHGVALFLLDLERFKNINYSLGRAAGDMLLRQVGEWLTHQSGDANLVARVGEDHFAVVVPSIAQHVDVARVLEKAMQALLVHPFHLDAAVLRVAARVGIAIWPHDGADADTLFKNAEAALKKAKSGGARYLFYSHEMTESVAHNLTLENQLRQALEKREFVLHYQPKMNIASGELTGAEALIRWNDPRTGLMPPGLFIPILEECGLIYEVGRWALAQAVDDYLRWQDAGLSPLRIAVNVSPVQLVHRNFLAELRRAVGLDSRAAGALELELTESLIMEDVKHSIASLQEIRAMGVSVAIDDFGTGFSSLSYLSKLPVDSLKIDRAFIADMTTSPAALALVSTIIGLAHSLKLKVVAEGVETASQLSLLRGLKCDEFQGFLLSRPVACDVFESKFLRPARA